MRQQRKFETYDTKLSADGRTVISKKSDDRTQNMLEVWDAGKGTICRVYFDIREQITDFHLERLIDRNFLFVCVTNMMRCYEIGPDGETCDHIMDVNLVLPGNPTAIGLYLGSEALYVNMNNRQLFQVKILHDLVNYDKSDNDF